MVTYFVHEPPDAAGNWLDQAERLVFVKDGFSWLAALVPVLWLLMKRMWLELLVFVAGSTLLFWAFSAAGAPNTASAILLIVQVIFGFEAGNLYSAALERRGWRLAGTVSGRKREDCERRFLEVWLPTRTEIPDGTIGATAPETVSVGSWSRTALARMKDVLTRDVYAKARS